MKRYSASPWSVWRMILMRARFAKALKPPAEEIASAICFLLRREASYVNGAVLYVDGGYDARFRSDAC